jgi:hypothetical protein
MRHIPLLISALLLAGCGAAMAEEQPAAVEKDTARISISWGDEPRVGAVDFRDDTGVIGETILTVDAVYEPLPQRPEDSRGMRWLKSPREWDPLMLAPLANGPRDVLAFLESAERGEATTEGVERGEPVTYYTATVRIDEFMASLSPERRAELAEIQSEWDGMEFQLAVDSAGRFRRAEFAFAEQETLTIELFDYGVAVDARAPDPRTVLTWDEYEKLLRAECERAKKQGRENEVPHCASCGAAEEEA